MQLRHIILTSLFLSCIVLSNCGGGGSGGGIVGIDGSGSRLSVSESGTINGFGSVIVNGVHYNTDNAKIYIRGELAEEYELEVGNFVVVVGYVDNNGQGFADEVHFQPLITGKIDAIDQGQDTLTVLGQTIILSDDTTLSSDIIPRNIEGLKVGQTITVSGISDDSHNIRATRVALTASPKLDFFGKIDSLSIYEQTYDINGTTIDYSAVQGSPTFSPGDWIAIRGSDFSNGILHASHLQKAMDYKQLKSVKTIKINGLVKELKSNGDFFIDRVPVKTTANTVFIDGDKSDLTKNTSLQVKGSLDKLYTLIADEVSFIPTPDTQVFGTISNIQYASIGERYIGTIDVQGDSFKIDIFTRLVGDQERRIAFHDLRISDTVLITGFYKNDKYVASAVTVDNRVFKENIIEMQDWVGPVMKDLQSFSLFKTIVITNEKTTYRDGPNVITQEHCFEKLSKGGYVQVRGHYDGYSMIATSVQIVHPRGSRSRSHSGSRSHSNKGSRP